MLDVVKIVRLQELKIIDWHIDLNTTENEYPWNFIEENTKWNFCLWHEEDIARIREIDDSKIVNAKRNIDKFNQNRNDTMERIDEWILSNILIEKRKREVELHSETPGMMIDRLSIIGLKKYHMEQELIRTDANEEHKLNCLKKAEILLEQRNDLARCLQIILTRIQNGDLEFKVYRQMKMYNDPNLNPQLYNHVR